jgi:hypothetical protein
VALLSSVGVTSVRAEGWAVATVGRAVVVGKGVRSQYMGNRLISGHR